MVGQVQEFVVGKLAKGEFFLASELEKLLPNGKMNQEWEDILKSFREEEKVFTRQRSTQTPEDHLAFCKQWYGKLGDGIWDSMFTFEKLLMDELHPTETDYSFSSKAGAEYARKLENLALKRYRDLKSTPAFLKLVRELKHARELVMPMVGENTLDVVSAVRMDLVNNTPVTPLTYHLLGAYSVSGLFKRVIQVTQIHQAQNNDDLDKWYEDLCNCIKLLLRTQ